MSHPAEAWKLEGISPRAYQHPADRAATAALAQIPYLDQVVRRLISLGYERALRAASLGSAVKLGQEQLPGIWVLHRQVFNTLDIETVPDLYLTQFPLANAFTIGSGKPIVLLNSELVRILDDEGRRVVLAHEAGHIHSDHVLYRTALVILMRLGAAELSCDRAAALVTRDPQAVCRTLMVIAAGEAADELNLDAFIAQGMDYSEKGTGLERLTRMLQQLGITHPMPVRRVRILLDWVQEGEYDRMVRGDYLRRGEEPSAREEADAAGTFYADRVGSAIQSAGSSVGEVGQQLGDWLKRVRSTDADDNDNDNS